MLLLTKRRPCALRAAQKAAGYGSISLVQMKGADSEWMGMNNKYGEAWELPVTPSLPWDFRIVSDDGQEVRVGTCVAHAHDAVPCAPRDLMCIRLRARGNGLIRVAC